MSILTTNNLTLSFADFDLFRGISVTVPNNGKIGLIGPNGIGKTSLLMIIAGINAPTDGKVHLAKGRRLGYLRQEAVEAFGSRDNTVYAEMLTVFARLQEQQECLHQLEAEMATHYSEELLEEYGRLQQAFEHAGGYDYDLRIQQTLDGLGLGKEAWDMPLNHLSGGQKTRALLARLLLEKPDLLMLDEPTNHLDTEAVEWLEHTLGEWEGAVLVASHDRYFLDNTVDTIWEMGRLGIVEYSGNYSAYLLQRDAQWELDQRVFEEEKERLLKEVDYIQRNWVRDSTHAQALGRLRRLTRDLAAVEAYGIGVFRSGKKWSQLDLHAERPMDVIDAIRAVNAISMPGRPPRIKPRLVSEGQSSNIVLRADGVTVGYPGNPLFRAEGVELRRGECAALIGPNGSGKTTFLKTLLGQLDPLEGEMYRGPSLKIGYFAQAHDELDDSLSVIDELTRHKAMHPGEARSYLATYLFRGDDVFKPVSALSGGERGRLALAILALEGTNFLVLDEPTNHLDLPAQEVLQEVLQEYRGTILLVSHDRYLVDRLATRIWELRAGRLNVFAGNYRQFVLSRTAPAGSKSRQLLLAPKPLVRDNSRETRKRQEALGRIEERIREQEEKVKRLASEMQHPGKRWSYDQIHAKSEEYARAQARLEELLGEWEKLAV
ncbi:MAG: ribosomal protection-like ABC-F family protein [Chloroflexota bacterium]